MAARRLTLEEFVEKARTKHGDLYDYSQVSYSTAHVKVPITCKVHGPFLQTPGNHLDGRGCPKCAYAKGRSVLRTTTEEFIEKAQKIHGDRYSYAYSEYRGHSAPVTIVCKIHGEFSQRADQHLLGRGCRKCGDLARAEINRKGITNFLLKAREAHGNTYDYSLVVYRRATEKVEILCRTHGSFMQPPNDHYKGHGCPKCKAELQSEKRSFTTKDFIEMATKVHGDRYDYSKVDYRGSGVPVEVICKIHGPFFPTSITHIHKASNCPSCVSNVTSKAEEELFAFVSGLNNKAYQRDRSLLRPKEVDIVIPDAKLGIEFCGLFWHRTSELKPSTYHRDKLAALESKGYRLITIFEDEWEEKKDVLKNVLSMLILGEYSERHYARKCSLKAVANKVAYEFYLAHHLQGPTPCGYHLGLYSQEGELISMASFSKNRAIYGGPTDPSRLELVRFCCKAGVSVVGALGKLCSGIKKELPEVSTVFSFVDKRWFTGASYLANGFIKIKDTVPNYWYVKGSFRYNRYGFAKHLLEKKLSNFDPTKTEKENMLAAGYSIIHDCGSLLMEKQV